MNEKKQIDTSSSNSNLTFGDPEPPKTTDQSEKITFTGSEKIAVILILSFFYFLIICLPSYFIGKGSDNLTVFYILLILGIVTSIRKLFAAAKLLSKQKKNTQRKENEKKMAKCKKCGKGGFFHPVNDNGLCISCVSLELNNTFEKINALSNKLSETEKALIKAENSLTPEVMSYAKDCDKIAELQEKQNAIKERIRELEDEFSEKKRQKEKEYRDKARECSSQLYNLEKDRDRLRAQVVVLEEQALLQSFGLYKPQYDFENSEKYKKELDKVREKQKQCIKNGTAIIGSDNWCIDGDYKKGGKMINDIKKLLMKAFNEECDELVRKVKYNNFEAYKKRIETSCSQISKLSTMLKISISPEYMRLKIDELTIAFEYAQKKHQEKEEQKTLREQMREEAKLLKELEEKRKNLEKEQLHYSKALDKINAQLQSNPNDPDLLIKKQELEKQAAEIEKAIEDVDYRAANKRAGYVYVISNIGAFGKDVYKIGMTRRLEPMDRIDELGSASVPFDFDVHALIFTDDAPGLEAALHQAFEDKKVNMVNQRREFFNVTLDEIKAVVRENYDKTVEFVDIPEAEQYRVSMKMKNKDITI